MEYMDTPRVKIYIHDSNTDIFYELENLGEIKDRTVLKLFEADSSGRGPCGLGPSGMPPITNSDELTPIPAAAGVVPPVAAAAAAAPPEQSTERERPDRGAAEERGLLHSSATPKLDQRRRGLCQIRTTRRA
jgi:hypothetical protein